MSSTRAFSRQVLIDHLSERLRDAPCVRAAWLAGSDASERTDAYSDVDFQVLVERPQVELCFRILHEVLEELSPILLQHRVPEPAWHGLSQEFLLLEGCSPHHFLDFVVMPTDTPLDKRLLERERHGVPLVLFDPEGHLENLPALDWSSWVPRIESRLRALRTTFPLYQTLVTRSVLRGLGAEAAGFYQAFCLKPLVELLRLRHCPQRFDFGLRYLDRDLTPEARELIEELAFPRDRAECESFRGRCQDRFELELAAFAAGDWKLSAPSAK